MSAARPHARFGGAGHQLGALAAAPGPTNTGAAPIESLTHAPHPSVPAAERVAANTRMRLLVLAVLRERGEMYSTELAEALGCSVARAKSLLIGLELRGAVCSEHRETTVSGHGRRYYRVRAAADYSEVT